MSLQPTQEFTILELTIQVAHAAFPKRNDWMRLRDELGRSSRMRHLRRCIRSVVSRRKRHGGWRW